MNEEERVYLYLEIRSNIKILNIEICFMNLIIIHSLAGGYKTGQESDIKPTVASGRHQWHHPHLPLLTTPSQLDKAAELDVPTKTDCEV